MEFLMKTKSYLYHCVANVLEVIRFLYNTGNKIRPGLDFCKMIIMNRNEINLYTSNVSVNRNVFADLNRKRSQIINMIHKTIDDYKTMRQKVENNVDLSSDEIFLKTRSTLKNWEDII